MKTQSTSPLQSGFFLRIVEDNVVYADAALEQHLKIVARSEKHIASSVRKEVNANDPANWDSSWFGNYE